MHQKQAMLVKLFGTNACRTDAALCRARYCLVGCCCIQGLDAWQPCGATILNSSARQTLSYDLTKIRHALASDTRRVLSVEGAAGSRHTQDNHTSSLPQAILLAWQTRLMLSETHGRRRGGLLRQGQAGPSDVQCFTQ